MHHRGALLRGAIALATVLIFLASVLPSLESDLAGLAGLTTMAAPALSGAAISVAFARAPRTPCSATYIPQVTEVDSFPIFDSHTSSALPLCAAHNDDADIHDAQAQHALMVRTITQAHLHELALQAVVVVKKTPTPNPGPSASAHPAPSSGGSGSGGSGSGGSGGYLGPCGGAYTWPSAIGLWVTPLGCFGKIFAPSAVSTGAWASPGYCNWVPEALHHTNNLTGLPREGLHVGAAVFFAGGVYGASAAGHWANVVSIHNGWMLIIEENFTWRGGGFGRVDYRYVPVGNGESFYG